MVDYDRLARTVVEPGSEGLSAVVGEFGPGVVGPDGRLDRAALAARVFADPAARARLEAALHPRIRSAAEAEERAARRSGASVVVHDIPLLAETGRRDGFDRVVVVEAPAEVRLRRLVTGRGLPESDARARIAAQATDDERLALADDVVDGSGSLEHLGAQVDALWTRWTGVTP